MTGRPRTFDEKKAISAAMSVFWANGFEGASYALLSDAMNMNRPSIYGAFGDKEALFLRTLDHYLEFYAKPTLAKLEMGANLRECLALFLNQVIDNCVSKKHPGCLVATVLTDSTMLSPRFFKRLQDVVSTADEHIAKRLKKALSNGEISPSSNIEILAQIINNTRYGFAVRARAGESKDKLQKIAYETISLVCGSLPTVKSSCSFDLAESCENSSKRSRYLVT